jgi:hypothetical protein
MCRCDLVSAYPATDAQVTDAETAKRTDLAFRWLRVAFVINATQWLFIACVMALVSTLPGLVDALAAIAGVACSAVAARYFETRRRRVLAQFADPITGEIRVPGGPASLPRRLQAWSVLVVACEVAMVLLLARR